jgi:hypothetical protein
MKDIRPMPILRLAYVAEFLLAIVAVFELWSQVGGQGHLDLLSWWLKLGLGAGAAFACVKATAAAVSSKQAWNGRTLRWCALLLTLLAGCGLSCWYAHLYFESGEDGDQQMEEPVNITSAHAGRLDSSLTSVRW